MVVGRGLQGWLLWEAARSIQGSNSDLPLAKAKSISDSGSASERTDLRRGGKTAQQNAAKERSENM